MYLNFESFTQAQRQLLISIVFVSSSRLESGDEACCNLRKMTFSKHVQIYDLLKVCKITSN